MSHPEQLPARESDAGPDCRKREDEHPSPAAQIEYTLANLEIWLELALEKLEYRGHGDQSGRPHGYSICPIPDWQVRQKLDEVRAARCIAGDLP